MKFETSLANRLSNLSRGLPTKIRFHRTQILSLLPPSSSSFHYLPIINTDYRHSPLQMEVCDSVNIYLFAKEKKVSEEEVCKQTSAISKKKHFSRDFGVEFTQKNNESL